MSDLYNIQVPTHLWAPFIDILFTAYRHIEETEESKEVLNFVRDTVYGAFEDQTVLIVDDKIVDRKTFSH